MDEGVGGASNSIRDTLETNFHSKVCSAFNEKKGRSSFRLNQKRRSGISPFVLAYACFMYELVSLYICLSFFFNFRIFPRLLTKRKIG